MTWFLMLFATAAFTAQAERSIAGTWSLESEVMGYPGSAVCVFTQEATKIAGKCTAEGVDRPVTGEVAGGKFTFQHASEYQGQALTIVYSGTLDSDTALAGEMIVKPFEVSGTFKAKKSAGTQAGAKAGAQAPQAAPQASPSVPPDQASPFSGRWLIHLSIIGRQGDQDCTLTQKGTELTGTCKSYDAAGDVEGTIDGNKVKWLLKRDIGSTGNLIYSGTLGPDGQIKGTVDVPAYTVSGEFTATRPPGAPAP